VLAVRLKKDRIVVVLSYKIYVYDMNTIQTIYSLETTNPKGLIAFSPDPERTTLAYPAQEQGYVNVYKQEDKQSSDISPVTLRVKASDMDREVCQIALNSDGTKLATTSSQGTRIRIWDITKKEPLQIAELVRGKDAATINCFSFSNDCKYLCCSSNKKTIHIFPLTGLQPVDTQSWGSYLSLYTAKAPMTSSKYQIRLNDTKVLCTFTDSETVIVLSNEGSFFKFKLDEKKR